MEGEFEHRMPGADPDDWSVGAGVPNRDERYRFVRLNMLDLEPGIVCAEFRHARTMTNDGSTARSVATQSANRRR